jgi:hypothetical protein
MTSSLFMAHEVMIDFVLLKAHRKYVNCAAWISKNMFNAFVRQCARTSISPPDKSSNVIHPNNFITAMVRHAAVFHSLIVCTVIAHIFLSFHSIGKISDCMLFEQYEIETCWDKHIFLLVHGLGWKACPLHEMTLYRRVIE